MEIYQLLTEWLKAPLERMDKKQATLSNDSEFVLKIKLFNSSTTAFWRQKTKNYATKIKMKNTKEEQHQYS